MKGWKKVMSEFEKQEFEDIISAMSEEEMKIAASKIAESNEDILWEELRKRTTANKNKLQAVQEIVSCI